MAADLASQEYPSSQSYENTNRQAQVPRPRSPGERPWSNHELQVLNGFYEYWANEGRDYDLDRARPEQGPDIAHTAHDFVAQVATNYIEAQARHHVSRVAKMPVLFIMPSAAVDKRIDEYYEQFGTHRRRKAPDLLAPEEKHLSHMRNVLHARVYGGGGVNDDGEQNPIKKVGARSDVYPEVFIAELLEGALRKDGHQTAADSVETLIAAYGSRFFNMYGNTGRAAVEGRSMGRIRVIRWGADEQIDDQI